MFSALNIIKARINVYIYVKDYSWIQLNMIDFVYLTHSIFCVNSIIFIVCKRSLIDGNYNFIYIEIWINEAYNINHIESQEE